jgi:hypothetical protein
MEMRDLTYNDWVLYFQGALLRHPTTGVPSYVREIGIEGIESRAASRPRVVVLESFTTTDPLKATAGRNGTMSEIRGEVLEQLANTNAFDVPTLGYRVYDKGRVVMYLSRNAVGARRGLTLDKVRFTPDAYIQNLNVGGDWMLYSEDVGKLVVMTFNPTNTPFVDGMDAMRNGDLLSFCINEDVLVRPSSVTGFDAELVFRNHAVVGRVSKNNRIVSAGVNDEALGELTGGSVNAA